MSDNMHKVDKTKASLNDDTVLKVAKEIAIKFIETGRITPATFDHTFKNIYTTIKEARDGQ